ncbi:hypothetical protein BZG36_04654 [Bifiguratus adelaidae]|uniref:Queuine tRNA-ribosyltransferase accessory subunit 2 n=1 Tax=Bifiguratus adelaidae TaxID=1938954 RepID=A0A261Y0D9_9FUNG|nr:hypothetical protein BZG36_04654 [Bifiguratus adelaidae]
MVLSFTLRKSTAETGSALTSTCRRGTLNLSQPGSVKSMPTPNFFAYTSRGSVPHLTTDNLKALNLPAIQLNLEQFFEEGDLASRDYPHGIKKYLNLQDYIVLCDLRDPIKIVPASFNTDTYVSTTSHGGVRKVTQDAWVSTINLYEPDIAAGMADFVLDQEPSKRRNQKSLQRTDNWLTDLLERKKPHINVFASVVGSVHKDDRERAANLSASHNVQGYVLNMLGQGVSPQKRVELMSLSLQHLPEDKPRVTYGLGSPEEILLAISNGMDMFDGSYPYIITDRGCASLYTLREPVPPSTITDPTDTTPLNGHGPLQSLNDTDSESSFTSTMYNDPTIINLGDKKYQRDFRPLMPDCECYACQTNSRAYIHHLLEAHEMLASVLLMTHNLWTYKRFFEDVRSSIDEGMFGRDCEAFWKAVDFDATKTYKEMEAKMEGIRLVSDKVTKKFRSL